MIQVFLPWPPSVNTYWRSVPWPPRRPRKVRVLISDRGRAYRLRVALLLRKHRGAFAASPVDVHLVAHPADRRRFDLDNLPKSILDAVTKAGVWDDDSQVARLLVERGDRMPGGAVFLAIREAGS